MRNKSLNLTLIAYLFFCASSVFAQQPTPPTVYISEVAIAETAAPDVRKIANAVNLLLELRLNSIKAVQVIKGKPECESKIETTAFSSQREEMSPQATLNDQPGHTYQVNSSIKTLASAVTSTGDIELVLDYDLVKYVRCRQASIIHRSEPISIGTAFVAIVQMGDVLEVAIKEDSASQKIRVDFVELTGASEVLRLKEQLTNTILIKLADQPDFQVRAFSEKPRTGDSDYIVTGEVISKSQRGVKFVVQSVQRNKSYYFFVPGPVGQKNPDEKALSEFYEKSAALVLNYIRTEKYPSNFSDADVKAIMDRALSLLCRGASAPPDCIAQPAQVIPDLVRLRDSNRTSPEILDLLGDAYTQITDHRRASEAYSEAWAKSSSSNNTTPDGSLSYLTKAAEAAYKAQDYAESAGRYDQLIELTRKNQPAPLNLYLQASRSYRFANEPRKAFERALEGLSRFPDSVELDGELETILHILSGENLEFAYETLVNYKNIPSVARRLPEVKNNLAMDLAEEVFDFLQGRKFQEAEKKLRYLETLSVASLSKENQIAYRLAQAFLIRESRNDFAGAILLLEPFAKDDSEFGLAARTLLADTFYRKGLAATAGSGKQDYARAVKIVEDFPENITESFILYVLVKANHELGEDKDSLDLLDEIVRKDRNPNAVVAAHAALAVLCVDYLGDLDKGEHHIKATGGQMQWDRDLMLRLATIHLARRRYTDAEPLLISTASDSERMLFEVEQFLKTWLELALKRPKNAETSFNAWRAQIESIRRTGGRVEWVFTAAQRGIETDSSLGPGEKDLLGRMISAMNDKGQRLPEPGDLFKEANPKPNP